MSFKTIIGIFLLLLALYRFYSAYAVHKAKKKIKKANKELDLCNGLKEVTYKNQF